MELQRKMKIREDFLDECSYLVDNGVDLVVRIVGLFHAEQLKIFK